MILSLPDQAFGARVGTGVIGM